MSSSLSPIEDLMHRKFSSLYKKLRDNPDKIKILKINLMALLSEEIQQFKKENNVVSPPFNPFQIKKIKGITIDIEFSPRSKIGVEGRLEILNNQFLIKLDESLQSKKNLYRLRTTMTHELMHILFYDLQSIPIKKLGYGTIPRNQILMEEELCHFLTREFLMPTKMVLDILENKEVIDYPSLHNMNWLKSKFLVSSDIIAYRMIKDLRLWEAIYAKYIQINLKFNPMTILKFNKNSFFKKTAFPRKIPSNKNEWQKFISSNIYKTIEENYVYQEKEIFNRYIISESKVDSNTPLSIVFLIKIKDMI